MKGPLLATALVLTLGFGTVAEGQVCTVNFQELDKRDFDTFVNRLHFPNLSVSPQNCEWDSCPSTPVQSWHSQTLASPGGPGTEAKVGLGIENAHYSFDCTTCEALPNDPCCAACGNN